MLKKVSAAQPGPVSVERAKQRLQIDVSDFDADLQSLIAAAIDATEGATGRVIGRSTWEYRLACWPAGCIHIPAAPIRDVTAISYIDEGGALQIVPSDKWTWDQTAEGAVVSFVPGFEFPALGRGTQVVRVVFDGGYDVPGESGSGDDPDLAFPPRVEMAVLFLVGHWFANREAVTVGPSPSNLPLTYTMLTEQLRIFR